VGVEEVRAAADLVDEDLREGQVRYHPELDDVLRRLRIYPFPHPDELDAFLPEVTRLDVSLALREGKPPAETFGTWRAHLPRPFEGMMVDAWVAYRRAGKPDLAARAVQVLTRRAGRPWPLDRAGESAAALVLDVLPALTGKRFVSNHGGFTGLLEGLPSLSAPQRFVLLERLVGLLSKPATQEHSPAVVARLLAALEDLPFLGTFEQEEQEKAPERVAQYVSLRAQVEGLSPAQRLPIVVRFLLDHADLEDVWNSPGRDWLRDHVGNARWMPSAERWRAWWEPASARTPASLLAAGLGTPDLETTPLPELLQHLGEIVDAHDEEGPNKPPRARWMHELLVLRAPPGTVPPLFGPRLVERWRAALGDLVPPAPGGRVHWALIASADADPEPPVLAHGSAELTLGQPWSLRTRGKQDLPIGDLPWSARARLGVPGPDARWPVPPARPVREVDYAVRCDLRLVQHGARLTLEGPSLVCIAPSREVTNERGRGSGPSQDTAYLIVPSRALVSQRVHLRVGVGPFAADARPWWRRDSSPERRASQSTPSLELTLLFYLERSGVAGGDADDALTTWRARATEVGTPGSLPAALRPARSAPPMATGLASTQGVALALRASDPAVARGFLTSDLIAPSLTAGLAARLVQARDAGRVEMPPDVEAACRAIRARLVLGLWWGGVFGVACAICAALLLLGGRTTRRIAAALLVPCGLALGGLRLQIGGTDMFTGIVGIAAACVGARSLAMGVHRPGALRALSTVFVSAAVLMLLGRFGVMPFTLYVTVAWLVLGAYALMPLASLSLRTHRPGRPRGRGEYAATVVGVGIIVLGILASTDSGEPWELWTAAGLGLTWFLVACIWPVPDPGPSRSRHGTHAAQ
jgi:hypothetical protein